MPNQTRQPEPLIAGINGETGVLIVLVGAGLSLYLTIWRRAIIFFLPIIERFPDDWRPWRIGDGYKWPTTAILVTSLLAAVAIVAEESRRDVRTAKGGLIVGLVIAAIAVPIWLALGISSGSAPYDAFCSGILTAGFVGASVTAALLRKLSGTIRRRRLRATPAWHDQQ